MFRKFSRDDIVSKSNLKSSTQRALRGTLCSNFPNFEPLIEEVMPKKSQVCHLKCQDKINLYTVNDELLFSQHSNEALAPALHFIHTLPRDAFPWVQVDRGAIKFLLAGANVMCPGLTSPGGRIPASYEKGQVVVIYAEGKENALAVGQLELSTDDIKAVNKGVGINTLSYLGDGLWHVGKNI